MSRRSITWVLLGLAVMAAGSCSSGQADKPPPLGQTALSLHVCLRTEPDNTGPCTDDALTSCPSGVTRDACLATALDELAAFDAYAASPPQENPGLPLPAILAILAATLGMFALIGWGVARRTAARNQRAFDDELPALLAEGFREAHGLHTYGIKTVGKVRRVLFRNGRAMVWLLESESLAFAVNALPPTRCAVIRFEHPVPTGQLTRSRGGASGPEGGVVSTFGNTPDELAFVQALRSIVDPLLPMVAVEAGGSHVVLRSVHVAKAIGKSPVPVSLIALGTAAVRIADSLPGDRH